MRTYSAKAPNCLTFSAAARSGLTWRIGVFRLSLDRFMQAMLTQDMDNKANKYCHACDGNSPNPNSPDFDPCDQVCEECLGRGYTVAVASALELLKQRGVTCEEYERFIAEIEGMPEI